MLIGLLQSFSVTDSFSFQIFFPGTSEEDNPHNEMSHDGVTVCHSSSSLYVMSYMYIELLRRNFCNQKGIKMEYKVWSLPQAL